MFSDCGPGCGRRDVGAELNRALRSGRRELDDPKTVIKGEIGVEAPSQALVEALRTIDVGPGNDRDLELQLDAHGVRGLRGVFTDRFCAAHCHLLIVCEWSHTPATLCTATFAASSCRVAPSTRLK